MFFPSHLAPWPTDLEHGPQADHWPQIPPLSKLALVDTRYGKRKEPTRARASKERWDRNQAIL